MILRLLIEVSKHGFNNPSLDAQKFRNECIAVLNTKTRGVILELVGVLPLIVVLPRFQPGSTS